MKSCFFIGHREASSEILPELRATIEQHIVEYGVTEFLVGHYGGCSALMYSEVIGGETIENNDEKQLDSTPVQLQSFYTNIRSLRMILSAAFLWRAGVTSAGKRRHRLR